MFILAEVDVYHVIISFFGVLVLDFLVGFMKWGVRNKTTKKKKRLKRAIFKLLVISYMHTTLYILFFYSRYEQVMLCENTRKSFNVQI